VRTETTVSQGQTLRIKTWIQGVKEGLPEKSRQLLHPDRLEQRRRSRKAFGRSPSLQFFNDGGALQHIEPQHPPDKEYCNNGSGDMNDPVANCFRFAEIEHDGIVARTEGRSAARHPYPKTIWARRS
jgi:hypothetical protein